MNLYIPCSCSVGTGCICRSLCTSRDSISCKCCKAPDGNCYECESIPDCITTSKCIFDPDSSSKYGLCECGGKTVNSPSGPVVIQKLFTFSKTHRNIIIAILFGLAFIGALVGGILGYKKRHINHSSS